MMKKFVEVEANITVAPFDVIDGPAVVNVGGPVPQLSPHSPWLASAPFTPVSSKTGRPAVRFGSTENAIMFESPPPGAGFTT